MKNLERYTKYLKGELSEKEQEEVAKELVKDYYQREAGKEKLKKILKQEEVQYTRKPKAKRIMLRIAAVAASFLLIVSIWTTYSQTQEMLTAEQLADNYIEVGYQPNDTRKGPVERLRNEAKRLYEKGEFQKAVKILKEMIDKEGKNALAKDYFELGINHLKIDNYNDAIKNFEVVLNHSSEEMFGEAYQFSRLAYIKTKNLAIAKEQLKDLANIGGKYDKEAQALLDAMARE